MSRWLLRAACVLVWLIGCAGAAALEPAELLARIRAPRLALDSAVSLRNVQLEMGPGVFAPARYGSRTPSPAARRR